MTRDQFETLYRRLEETTDGFDPDRLPPDADPYPTVVSLHPRFEIDAWAGTITENRSAVSTPIVDTDYCPATATDADTTRAEPANLDLYSDALVGCTRPLEWVVPGSRPCPVSRIDF